MEHNSIMDCRLCGAAPLALYSHGLPGVSSDAKPYLSVPGTIAACERCGLVQKAQTAFWNRVAAEVYAAYDIYHQADGGAEQQVFTDGGASPRSFRLLRRMVEEGRLPTSGKMLDIGCGNGAMIRAAKWLLPGWTLAGHDLDDRHRERVLLIPHVEQFYAGPLDGIVDRFALIALSHVLEHVPDPVGFLKDVAGLLAPGGQILIQVPDAEANPFDLMVVDHASHFDGLTLARALRKAGLDDAGVWYGWVPKELTVVAHPCPKPARNLPRRALALPVPRLPPARAGRDPGTARGVRHLRHQHRRRLGRDCQGVAVVLRGRRPIAAGALTRREPYPGPGGCSRGQHRLPSDATSAGDCRPRPSRGAVSSGAMAGAASDGGYRMITPWVVPLTCRERGCTLTTWEDICSMRHIFQHGERPEAVMFIDRATLVAREDVYAQVRDFVERCHRYEDGVSMEATA